MTLTIYSEDFDETDSISDGFCGNVFLDPVSPEGVGTSFGKSLSNAMKRITSSDEKIDEILFCYRDGEEQMFKRFRI